MRNFLKVALFLISCVSFPAYALRIIALAPHLTEMIYAVGAGNDLVGVSEYSDFPPQAKTLPVVSHLEKTNLEQILALKPDLLLAWKEGAADPNINALSTLGIRVVSISTKTVLDIPSNLIQIGVLSGHRQEGRQASEIFLRQYQHLKTEFPQSTRTQSVFLELFDSPLYTPGQASFLIPILSLCGGRSLFPSLRGEASPVSLESVIAGNPEVILVLKPSKASVWQAWPSIKAVKNHRVYEMNPDILARPGPRIVEGIRQVCERLKVFA